MLAKAVASFLHPGNRWLGLALFGRSPCVMFGAVRHSRPGKLLPPVLSSLPENHPGLCDLAHTGPPICAGSDGHVPSIDQATVNRLKAVGAWIGFGADLHTRSRGT